MDQRQCNAHARALVCEGIGKLRAASQFIGTAPHDVPGDHLEAFQEFEDRVAALEAWISDYSGLA